MLSFKASCIQLCSSRTVDDNIEHTLYLIEKAALEGASYIQTPEMTHLVESTRVELMAKIHHQDTDEGVKAFQKLAKRLGIYLHIGSLAILRQDGKVANRGFFFSPEGALLSTYDKIHMFDVDLDGGESWRESNTYQAGELSPVIKTELGNWGMAICYDLRFAGLFQNQAQKGAEILTAPSCFTKQTGKAHWHILNRARAIENTSFMISAGQGGKHEDGRTTFGHSIIIDPWGKILAEADNDKPGFIIADIDKEVLKAVRNKIPSLTHLQKFDTACT